jgi:hypothetical protein
VGLNSLKSLNLTNGYPNKNKNNNNNKNKNNNNKVKSKPLELRSRVKNPEKIECFSPSQSTVFLQGTSWLSKTNFERRFSPFYPLHCNVTELATKLSQIPPALPALQL